MKKFNPLIILVYCLLFYGCVESRINTMNDKQTFIRFASGFNSDTVSVKLNNTVLLSGEVLTSNRQQNDITSSLLKIKKDSIFYYKEGKLNMAKKLDTIYNDKVIVEFITDNRPYSFTMYFRNGRYLFISKHSYYYNVYFNQFIKKPELY